MTAAPNTQLSARGWMLHPLHYVRRHNLRPIPGTAGTFRAAVKPAARFADSSTTMAIDINNPYFRTKVLTASQEELRLLLIDGCLRFLRLGREALAAQQWEGVYTNLSQAKDIILELLNALRPDIDPELCQRLSGLYTWMLITITESGFHKDPARLDSVIDTMAYERETWAMLMDKLARERARPEAAAPAPAPAGPHRPLSISA